MSVLVVSSLWLLSNFNSVIFFYTSVVFSYYHVNGGKFINFAYQTVPFSTVSLKWAKTSIVQGYCKSKVSKHPKVFLRWSFSYRKSKNNLYFLSFYRTSSWSESHLFSSSLGQFRTQVFVFCGRRLRTKICSRSVIAILLPSENSLSICLTDSTRFLNLHLSLFVSSRCGLAVM